MAQRRHYVHRATHDAPVPDDLRPLRGGDPAAGLRPPPGVRRTHRRPAHRHVGRVTSLRDARHHDAGDGA